MTKANIKVFRIGPIAAFDRSAHSIRQILLSTYFARYGVESFIYLRNLKPKEGKEKLSQFLGIDFPENLNIKLTVKHKGISSAINTALLMKDLINEYEGKKWVFLSKSSHVIRLSKFKKLLNFKIVFENHQDKPYIEAVKRADLVYTVSPKVYREVKEFQNVKLWTYHYPIREDFINFKPNFRKRNVYTLGYIGSLNPEKGVDFLLHVIKELPVKLKIIGRDDSRLKPLVKELRIESKVEFTGFIPQNKLTEELKDVDILVAPFKRSQKTIPLKVYEYLALGIPTISSDIEPVRVVAKDIFFYYAPEDKNSFIKAYKKVIENPDRTSKKIRKSKTIGKGFLWNSVIEKILKDLEEVC